MKTVTCSYCGKQWLDDHPDFPGAVIWCGECNRNGVIGVANRITVYDNQVPCLYKTASGQFFDKWLPAGHYYRDGFELVYSNNNNKFEAVRLISANPKDTKKYLVHPDDLLKATSAT
jgi:hypothetical protein